MNAPLPRYAKSAQAHQRATALMPGGVSSPVRAFNAVGRDPVTVTHGEGPYVFDVDGNRYVDFVMSYGPLIHGHAPASVIEAITRTAAQGTSFGMTTALESDLAEVVIDAVPGVELVRFVNSGPESAMSALRLARAATERDLIIKCKGCYHGHTDALLVQAGSGATTLGTPSSPGVPEAVVKGTILVPFNDLQAVEDVMKQYPNEIACMAAEPIAGNMGLIPPADGYLEGLRELCDKHDVLLLFDEVMTGFRVARGCAQDLYDVTPDLTCLGKVIGGGLPCAAYGGREDLMRHVAPDGPMYQAGTLSGNPLAMAAGLETMRLLTDDAYTKLEATAQRLCDGLQSAAQKAGVPLQTPHVGSMIGCFFSDTPVTNYADATTCDIAGFTTFFNEMLNHGVMLAPSAYETWFVSTAHDDASIDEAIAAAEKALLAVATMER